MQQLTELKCEYAAQEEQCHMEDRAFLDGVDHTRIGIRMVSCWERFPQPVIDKSAIVIYSTVLHAMAVRDGSTYHCHGDCLTLNEFVQKSTRFAHITMRRDPFCMHIAPSYVPRCPFA